MNFRPQILLAAILPVVVATSALCASFDVDGDLMRGIDDTAKDLDSSVAQKDAKTAAADARSLVETFSHVEAHYAEKPETADAVGFAHKTQDLAAQALKAIEADDFDAASAAVEELTRSCKNCHNVYKKD